MTITGNTTNVLPALLARLSAWNEAVGNKYLVDIGYRSLDAQKIAYAKYLAGTGPTAAKPGASMHNRTPAEAVDLAGWSMKAGSGHTTRDERVLGKEFGLTWPVGFKASGSVEFGTTEPWHVEVLPGSILVDGDFGKGSITRLQKFLGVNADGDFGPVTKRKLQSYLGVKVDGDFGPASTRALQSKVGSGADGVWGQDTTKRLQRFLNAKL